MINTEQAQRRAEQIISNLSTFLATKPLLIESYGPDFGKANAIVASSKSFVSKLLSGSGSIYLKQIEEMQLSPGGADANTSKLYLLKGTLEAIRDEMEIGILTSLVSQAQARVFGDFISYAESLLSENDKDPAGVIMGVTFEDTLRKLARRNTIVEASTNVEKVIQDLVKAGVLNDIEADMARACAKLRNSAVHARWSEFSASDIRTALEFLRGNLIVKLGA
ncbi:MAG TPA: hypothetical protein VFV07_07035 [Rhizomicrobium sp.]|nr:hypothetical protein [Rhizomicrobium sp.]